MVYTGNRVTRRAPVDDKDQSAIKDNPVSTAILAPLQAIDGRLDSLPFDTLASRRLHPVQSTIGERRPLSAGSNAGRPQGLGASNVQTPQSATRLCHSGSRAKAFAFSSQ